MEHPGSQDMREAVERLAAAMDKSRKELEGLARRDVALRARYRTSVTRVAERAIPDLRRRTLEQLLTDHRFFIDDAVLDVFARNGVMARMLNTRRYAASLSSLRDSFCDYIGRSGKAPFASARAEIAAIEALMVIARAEEADAAGVLAGMRIVLANEIAIPGELVPDIRLVCRPRFRRAASVTVSIESGMSGVVSEHSGIPQTVRQFALSVAVA
ncbi:hypothetical protein PAQ31011_00638 [Pandoraea aquatica]|uniref:Uncharacterized protein n=1 Tax=Pandoraea aquatica TaxID=2508290 RepID=A0A5E4S7I8_9BURK|nr:hypothetical protein [Pandoraea aquatica]VVD71587.1 hypothetical protein PAQ31011_00638 [Pandoraea aquatica]